MTFIIRSPLFGSDGENAQKTEPASGRLSGSPKLTFARDSGGDTITRKEGTWDRDDGFAIGHKITISGVFNAGDFTIVNMVNGGRTLVLDVANSVDQIVTKALSIAGAVEAPVDDSSVDDSSIGDEPIHDAPKHSDGDPIDGEPSSNRVTLDAPAGESTDESVDICETGGLFADAPAGDSSSIEDSQIRGDHQSEAGDAVMDASAANSPTSGDDDVEASRRATHAPGRAIRSRFEVEKLLLALCEEKLTVTAYPEDGELLFAARVLAVDPDLSRMVLEYSQWKPANSALLECKQVLFHCERKNRHIQFLAGAPSETVYGGSAGIQIGFPQFVLDLQQRTERRFRLATRPSMWCVIKQGGADPIVANVDDISRGGLGGIVHDPGVVLKPGMIIKDCQITGSELKRPIDVSVEIRYWKTIRSAEGVLSKRVGCRFVASSADLQQLIDVFIVDLDDGLP